jgi:YHS domain-containing protein
MLKKSFVAAAVLFAVVALAVHADDMKGTQTKCPVMGNPINKEVYVDHKDMRVFFCCEACIGEFKKDPAKYIEKMKAAGEKPMMLARQSVCPVTGEELPMNAPFVDVMGKRVQLCCNGCVKAVKENPEKYLKKIAERGEYVEDAPKKDSM